MDEYVVLRSTPMVGAVIRDVFNDSGEETCIHPCIMRDEFEPQRYWCKRTHRVGGVEVGWMELNQM